MGGRKKLIVVCRLSDFAGRRFFPYLCPLNLTRQPLRLRIRNICGDEMVHVLKNNFVKTNNTGKGFMETQEQKRPFIFRERTDLDEFLEEDPMWEELYDLYLHMKRDTSLTLDATTTFKEVCSICARVMREKHPEENVREDFLMPLDKIANVNRDICASLAYAILKLISNPPRKVERFTEELHYILYPDDDWFEIYSFSESYLGIVCKFVEKKGEGCWNVNLSVKPLDSLASKALAKAENAVQEGNPIAVTEIINAFLEGANAAIEQSAKDHQVIAYAFDKISKLEESLRQSAAEVQKQLDVNRALNEICQQREKERNALDYKVKELKEALEQHNICKKIEQDSEALLAVLLEAYKELDEAAMTKFEAAFSQLNDDSDHFFQKQLDCFRKVRREKAKGKKQATVMNIDNRGGYAFVQSELKDSKLI